MSQKIPVSDLLVPKETLDGIFRGVVEDNKDPDNAGRCRVRILGVHPVAKTQDEDTDEKNFIPTDELPWAHQVTGLSGNAASSIPQQGAFVFCFFENGNPSQPRYFGIVPGTETGTPKPIEQKINGLCQENGENKPVPEEVVPADPNASFLGYLVRESSDDTGTKGTLTIKVKNPDGSAGMVVFKAATLELPWRNNMQGKSCFPKGTYNCKYTASGKASLTKTYEIQGTPGRAGCRLHRWNWGGNKDLGFRADIEGCVLIGENVVDNADNSRGKRQKRCNNGTKVEGLPSALREKPFVLTVSGVVG